LSDDQLHLAGDDAVLAQDQQRAILETPSGFVRVVVAVDRFIRLKDEGRAQDVALRPGFEAEDVAGQPIDAESGGLSCHYVSA
jgi:hypothetical protein